MTKESLKLEISRLYKESGKFPKIERLAQISALPMYRVTLLLKEFVTDGFLLRVGNWYRFPEQLETIPEYQGELITQPKKKVEEKPAAVDPLTIRIIKWSMGIIGIGMVGVSGYYTAIWMSEYLPPFLAWFFSILAVSFSVMAFEVAIYFRSIRRTAISWLFLGLWLVVFLFSIGSTIAGQYNQEVNNQNESIIKAETTSGNKALFSIKEEDKLRLQLAVKSKQARQKQLLVKLAEYDSKPLDQEYKDARWEFGKIETDIKTIGQEQKALGAEMEKLIALDPALLSKKESAGFYDWLGKIFGTDTGWIKFLFFLFPAILIDLLAPIGIAVFLFLRENSYNNAETKND